MTVAGSAPVLLMLVAWALAPLLADDDPESTTSIEKSTNVPAGPGQSLDAAGCESTRFDRMVFDRVNLWNPPPSPADDAIAPATPPPAPRFTADLLAIITEGDRRAATFYDPLTDELRTVRLGDRIESFAVASINAGGVTLTNEVRSVTLTLDSGVSVGGAAGRRRR